MAWDKKELGWKSAEAIQKYWDRDEINECGEKRIPPNLFRGEGGFS